MYFLRTYYKINGPLSTSLYYNVAKNFSNNIGMIIEFNINTTHSRLCQNGLSVEFFSKYKHEKEVLFYNNKWTIVNITLYNIRSHHFKYFLNGLMLLQSILSGNIGQHRKIQK